MVLARSKLHLALAAVFIAAVAWCTAPALAAMCPTVMPHGVAECPFIATTAMGAASFAGLASALAVVASPYRNAPSVVALASYANIRCQYPVRMFVVPLRI